MKTPQFEVRYRKIHDKNLKKEKNDIGTLTIHIHVKNTEKLSKTKQNLHQTLLNHQHLLAQLIHIRT